MSKGSTGTEAANGRPDAPVFDLAGNGFPEEITEIEFVGIAETAGKLQAVEVARRML